MKFKQLSDWIMVEHCATRVIKGGDPMNIEHRVAFIEKTPRVRISNQLRYVEEGLGVACIDTEYGGVTLLDSVVGNRNIWIQGPKG